MPESGTVSKTAVPNCVIAACKINTNKNTPSISLLFKMFLNIGVSSSSLQLNALNNWKSTKSGTIMHNKQKKRTQRSVKDARDCA